MAYAETDPIVIDRVQCFAVSARPPVGPESSLGRMPVRNGLLIALTTQDGVTGWGEIWCNFPPRGNIARQNLMQDVIAPRLIGTRFASYSECRLALENDLARMMIHTGEFGPFAHCLAGIDTAVADIAARQQGVPLCQFLSGKAPQTVPVYASTPNLAQMEDSVGEIIDMGHTGVKLKIGHGLARDREILSGVATAAKGRLKIMVDANQNWTVSEAIETVSALSDAGLGFVEEPLRADAPLSDWAELAQAVDAPLAGGENITSFQQFHDFISHGKLRVVQPDVAKWGGVSGTYAVGQHAATAGATCTMHYMGTGLGLAASFHVLAAIGGSGLVELDANPNPLRTDLGEIDLAVSGGRVGVPRGPGIGFSPDPDALRAMSVDSFDLSN